jgi:hypothetical protein
MSSLSYAVQANLLHPGWKQRYNKAWAERVRKPADHRGHFARGNDGQDYWITNTPEWDAQWFRLNNMRLPLFGDAALTYWRDCGDGLKQLSIVA